MFEQIQTRTRREPSSLVTFLYAAVALLVETVTGLRYAHWLLAGIPGQVCLALLCGAAMIVIGIYFASTRGRITRRTSMLMSLVTATGCIVASLFAS